MIRQANSLLIIFIGFFAAYWIRFDTAVLSQGYWLALSISMFLAAVILPATGAFRADFEWQIMRRMRRLIAGWAVVLVMLVGIAAITKSTDYFSRIWFGLWTVISMSGLVAAMTVSYIASTRERSQKRRTRPIVLVGSGNVAARLESLIKSSPASEMFIIQRFGQAWASESTRPVSDLSDYIKEADVDSVWIAVPWEEKRILHDTLGELQESVVDVNVVPDLDEYRILNQSINEWEGMPVIKLSDTPMSSAEAGLKALMDRVGAFLFLLVVSPLLLLISLLILVSDGRPVFFRQKRHGIGGEVIDTLKFRTMKLESEKEGFRQASQEDDRVTGIGKLLRKTSLDELPQLVNVLKGEMSLVGPRPHPIELNVEYMSRIPRYMLRHKVKPGLTGWAQVNGFRGQTDTEEKMAQRIEHDLWYIQNWTLWLDLRILLMTPFVMIHRNAY